MVKYREILRLAAMGVSQNSIAFSCGCAQSTVSDVLRAARAHQLSWPLPEDLPVLDHFLLLFSRWPRAPFAPIEVLLEKEAPLAGRVAIFLVGVYQPIVERRSKSGVIVSITSP